MMQFNLVFWVFGLVLQGILLALLFTRGIFRRVPVFTILISFYVLRSIALYVVSTHLLSPSRILIFSGFAAIDILLQTIAAWELFSAITRSPTRPPSPDAPHREGQATAPSDKPLLRRLATFSIFLVAASAFAFVGSTFLHANPRAVIDRSILFTSALFIMVFLTSLPRNAPVQIQRLVQGLALYAVASIVCQMGRTIAGAQRNGVAFNRWSYAESVAYVAVILFWIIALPKERLH